MVKDSRERGEGTEMGLSRGLNSELDPRDRKVGSMNFCTSRGMAAKMAWRTTSLLFV